MNNLSPDMEVTIKLEKLNEMIEKRAKEIANKIVGEANLALVNNPNLIKDGGKVYIIYEKEGNSEKITEFHKPYAAMAYLSNKYNYKLSRASFDNLKNRLKDKPERLTKLDLAFRDKVLRIETKKKNI